MNKIRLNSWGGFGSQLFAYNLLEKLRIDFKDRDIEFIHHTSGVTKRDFELKIPFTQPKKINDDFSQISLSNSVIRYRYLNILQDIAKKFLKKYGIILTFDTLEDMKRINSKRIEIRGHYSYLEINKTDASKVFNTLKLSAEINDVPINNKNSDQITVHYRLGDLLTEEIGKLPTSLNSLHKTIEISLLKKISKGITIFSDSPTVAASNLSQLFDSDFEYKKSMRNNVVSG